MPSRNFVLKSLGRDLEALKPFLNPVMLPRGRHLTEPDDPISQVYFPVRGLVSSRVIFEGAQEIELAPTGYNSAIGILAGVGFPRSLTRDVCLTETQGWIVQLGDFESFLARSPAAAEAVRDFCYAQMTYAVRAATCNAVHTAEQRLARWLLLATELLGRDGVRLSQDDLGQVIGVGRTIINLLLQRFRRDGLIEVGRQRIEVLDEAQLHLRTCECHDLLRKAMRAGSTETKALPRATLSGA